MLYNSYNISVLKYVFVALLLTITCIAFQTNTNASENNIELTAEDYRFKGFVEHKKGNLNDALAYYDKALSLGLKNAKVFNDIGIVCEEIGVLLKAEYYYREAIEIGPDYLPAYMNLAYLYIEKGFPEKAVKYLKKRYELGDLDNFWTLRAKEELLRIDPESIHWINRIDKKRIKNKAELFEKEILDKARYEFEELVETAETHFKQGNDYLEEAKYDQARVEFERALLFTPDNPKIMEALIASYAKQGEALLKEGRYDEAISIYDLSLEIKPNNPQILVKRDFAALELIKLKIYHHLDEVRNMVRSGDFISAKKEIRKVLSIIPND